MASISDGLTKQQKKILGVVYERMLANEHSLLGQLFSGEDVAALVKGGLLVIEKTDSLIWAKDDPRIERIECVEIVRLTEEGKRIVGLFPKSN